MTGQQQGLEHANDIPPTSGETTWLARLLIAASEDLREILEASQFSLHRTPQLEPDCEIPTSPISRSYDP